MSDCRADHAVQRLCDRLRNLPWEEIIFNRADFLGKPAQSYSHLLPSSSFVIRLSSFYITVPTLFTTFRRLPAHSDLKSIKSQPEKRHGAISSVLRPQPLPQNHCLRINRPNLTRTYNELPIYQRVRQHSPFSFPLPPERMSSADGLGYSQAPLLAVKPPNAETSSSPASNRHESIPTWPSLSKAATDW